MDSRRIKYHMQSALEGIRYSKNIIVSAIVIVMSALCLFGAYILISVNMDYISVQFQKQYVITAFIEKGTPEDRIASIESEIGLLENIRNVRFVSEKESFEECKALFGESGNFLNGLEEDNPLRAYFEITPDKLNHTESVAEGLKNITDVAWVKNNQEFALRIMDVTSFLKIGSMMIMLLFSIISVFIIANTVKILIMNRKDDILAMRYLGATNDFIIFPFIIEGAIIGLIGALAALILVLAGYYICSEKIMSLTGGLFKLYRTYQVTVKLVVYLIISGLLLGSVGSAYALRKHIKV